MLSSALLSVVTFTGFVSGAPYLGGHVYQPLAEPLVYINANPVLYHQPYQQVYRFQPYHQQVITKPELYHQQVITKPQPYHQQVINKPQLYQVNTESSEELPEMNQFHSEDAEGRVLYGFHGHNQARMEARDPQGRVRGSYSYLDPRGEVVRMDYWDDGTGFQARGNHIPKATYVVPGFTAEVQAARDEHFKLYQQILLSTLHAQLPDKIHEEDYAYVERPDGLVSTPIGLDEDDTVEVGVYPNNPSLEDEPSYPGSMRIPGEIPLNNFPVKQDQNEEDLESIALDNPEFQDLSRGAKSLEEKDTKQGEANQQDKVGKPDKQEKEEQKDEEKENKKTQEKVTGDKETTGKIDKKTAQDKPTKKEDLVDESNNRHNGFSYNFQYILPGGHTNSELGPNFSKISSIAASEPVPKDKKTSLHSVHPLPLHTMTSMNDHVIFKTAPGPSAFHDPQVAPHQASLQQPLIIKSFPAPVSAVHDNQIPIKRVSHNNGKTELPH